MIPDWQEQANYFAAMLKAVQEKPDSGIADGDAAAVQELRAPDQAEDVGRNIEAVGEPAEVRPEDAADGHGIENKWVPIPGGTFQMGCSTGDYECDEDEFPRHSVTLSGFEMLETEVTQAQFEAVMKWDPSCNYGGGGGADSPVECVDWFRAKDYCEAIGGRLPTEAEWEYAARGGTTTKYYCGDAPECLNDIAWYDENSSVIKQPVRKKWPNAYGLYDMLGNVMEWTNDWYYSDYYYFSPSSNPQGPESSDTLGAQVQLSPNAAGAFCCNARH
jgi:formylglycine-generating enzyme required for sulfatase activity